MALDQHLGDLHGVERGALAQIVGDAPKAQPVRNRQIATDAADEHGILAGGLDGVVKKRDPGKRLDINMYTDGHTVTTARKLPLNLLDALRVLEGSKVMGERLGALVPSYLKLKREEWNAYARHLSPWERENTLDC